jgi:rhamnosyltransferase
MAPSVAIIIRTKDEERFIGDTLAAVSNQSATPDEIIIVDSGSKDRTLHIASQFKTDIIEIDASHFTYGGALNVGFARAESDILVSLSADAKPVDTEWLQRLIAPFKDPRVAGVYGRQIPRPGTVLPERRDMLKCYGTKRLDKSDDYFFSNVNSAVRREVWEKVRFDETVRCAEDWGWAKRVQELGHIIHYEPDAAVSHSHNYSFVHIYRRAADVAFGAATLDSTLRMNLTNVLGEVIKETARDVRFGMGIGRWFACFFPVMYRIASALGRYEGLRKGRRAHTGVTE